MNVQLLPQKCKEYKVVNNKHKVPQCHIYIYFTYFNLGVCQGEHPSGSGYKPCVFPFKSGGQEYNYCIKNNERYWCATSVDNLLIYKETNVLVNRYLMRHGVIGQSFPDKITLD